MSSYMQAPNMFTFLTTISHDKKKAARRLSQWQFFFNAEPVSNTGEMKGVLWLYFDFFTYFSTQRTADYSNLYS